MSNTESNRKMDDHDVLTGTGFGQPRTVITCHDVDGYNCECCVCHGGYNCRSMSRCNRKATHLTSKTHKRWEKVVSIYGKEGGETVICEICNSKFYKAEQSKHNNSTKHRLLSKSESVENKETSSLYGLEVAIQIAFAYIITVVNN